LWQVYLAKHDVESGFGGPLLRNREFKTRLSKKFF
jgi:hypothetical protein